MAKPLMHNGKSYTNADSWRTARATQAPKGGMAKPMGGAPESGMEPQEEDGAAIANEHGPANQVAMEHDHEMGVHSVHSVHPDGHEHHSEHGSAEEAHEHGKKLAGVGAEKSEHDEEEPEGDGEEW